MRYFAFLFIAFIFATIFSCIKMCPELTSTVTPPDDSTHLPVDTTKTDSTTLPPDSTSTPPDSVKTVTIQPDGDSVEYAIVTVRDGTSFSNLIGNPDIVASAWTYNGDPYFPANFGINRTYIKFEEVSSIPSNVKIISAILNLYGLDDNLAEASPEGNSDYPGSPYTASGYNANNECWLKRALSDWNQSTITWDNKPATTDDNEVTVPASNAQWDYSPKIDVTGLVRAMVTQKANYGFCLQLKDEEIYKNIGFTGSRSSDVARHPKLVISYTEN